MNAKAIIPVLLFAAVIPSVTNAATVDHYFSSGVYGNASFSTFDGCTYSDGYVDIPESTIKGNGPATPVPTAYVSFCPTTPALWNTTISFLQALAI